MGTARRESAPHGDGELADPTVTDQRLARGARSRRTVLRHAVDMASLEGLESLSFGRLAAQSGLSKAGVQTLFTTKQALQMATIDLARQLFLDAVVRPAMAAAPGVPRLRSLFEHWIAYAEAPLFAGGCFRVANLADFDSRPGPVRDALARDQRDWLSLLAKELGHAAAARQAVVPDADLAAFQIDAVLCATNTALRLGDPTAISNARRTVDGVLGSPPAQAADS